MTRVAQDSGHRLVRIFENARPVIPFFTAGFPSPRVFLDSATAAVEAGAGAMEIGMPFSDPLADGPAIQFSSQAALDRGLICLRC
jgi:tryptophan synthase alpha chain